MASEEKDGLETITDSETSNPKANFKVGVDNSPELVHEFNFSMAHTSLQQSGGAELGRPLVDFFDEDDYELGCWDDLGVAHSQHPGDNGFFNPDDQLANLIAIERVDSRDVVFDNRPKKTKILGKYVMGDVLGEGSYAKVKECIDQESLCRRAIKIMKRKKLRKIPNGEQNVQREIELVRNLKHSNVMQLMEVFYNEEKGKIYMVLEYCCAVLKDMLDKSPMKKFPSWQAHFYFNQLTTGLEYLHSNRVIHKDIKPGNLLLDTAGVLKIADFGVAEQLELFAPSDLITTSQGTPAFQPPEVAQGASDFAGFKLDIWSSGITLYNFVTGTYPFEGETIFRLFENIAKGDFQVPRNDVDPLLEDLIRGMLATNPEDRSDLQDVQDHDWCKKNHPCNAPPVTITPRNEDNTLSTTVLPYLMELHSLGTGTDEDQPYITEHDMHEHKRQRQAEAAALINHATSAASNHATSAAVVDRRRSQTTKCIKVKKMTGCIVS